MRRLCLVMTFFAVVMNSRSIEAHPAPFTYLDVYLRPGGVDTTLVVHTFDLGHDLQVDANRLLDATELRGRETEISRLLTNRVLFGIEDGPFVSGRWTNMVALPERQAVQIDGRFELGSNLGNLRLRAKLFPYDPAHQTFVNVYENNGLTLQAILDASKTDLEYYAGSRQGLLAVGRRFLPEGFRHIAGGLDHWLFLVGLLLAGTSPRRWGILLCALVVGHAGAGVLRALNFVRPSPQFIEPVVALTIVYAGADNLMVRGGRDVRSWISLAFGVFHGFWFASALGQMNLPNRAILWSLFSFDLGAALADLLIMTAVAAAVTLVRRRGEPTASRLLTIGSIGIIAGGVYFFVSRVFLQGGST
jgi:hypothetical protein